MPLVHVELIEGRSDKAKKKMAQEIIETIHTYANAPKEHIHVIFNDMKRSNYFHEEGSNK